MSTPAPPRLPIPQGYSLTLNMTQGGQPCVVVLGGKGLGSWDGVTGVAVWRDAAWNAFRNLAGSALQCTGAVLRDLQVASGPVFEAGPPTATGGTIAGDKAILAASSLIKWSTAQGGRSGKGRTYFPGLMSGMVDSTGARITTAHGTAIGTAVTSYLTSSTLAAAGLQPAVLSFTKGAAYQIVSGAGASVVGVQRRRMR